MPRDGVTQDSPSATALINLCKGDSGSLGVSLLEGSEEENSAQSELLESSVLVSVISRPFWVQDSVK